MSCKYSVSSVRRVMTCDPSDVAVDGNTATIREAQALDSKTVELTSESSLDNTYTFEKSLKITFNGRNVLNVDGKRFVIEDEKGDCYLMEEEFGDSLTWKYTLSASEDTTEWTISMDTNLQVMPCEVTDVGFYDNCGYYRSPKPEVTVYAKASSLFDTVHSRVMTDAKTLLEGNATFTEAYDGVAYEDSVQIVMPLSGDDLEDSMDIQAFMKYRHMVSVRKGEGAFVVGTEHGADCRSVISAATEESDGSLTLVFSTVTDRMAPWVNPFSEVVMPYEDIFYDFVKYAHDGSEGFVCLGNGSALYVLQRGYWQDGTATLKYKVKSGYESMFPDLDVVGVFYGSMYFDNPGCAPNYSMSTTFPSSITFNQQQESISGVVYASTGADWRIASVPDVVSLSESGGESGGTNVTITATGRTGAGQIVLEDTNGATQVIYVTFNPGTVKITPTSHDATAYTVEITSTGAEPTLVASPSVATTTKVGTGSWTAVVPANPGALSRTLTWTFDHAGVQTAVSSAQAGKQVRWIKTGSYICDNGDMYEEERQLVSLDGVNWTATAEVRDGDLIESGSSLCPQP